MLFVVFLFFFFSHSKKCWQVHGNDISLCVGASEIIICKHLRSKQRSGGPIWFHKLLCFYTHTENKSLQTKMWGCFLSSEVSEKINAGFPATYLRSGQVSSLWYSGHKDRTASTTPPLLAESGWRLQQAWASEEDGCGKMQMNARQVFVMVRTLTLIPWGSQVLIQPPSKWTRIRVGKPCTPNSLYHWPR